MAKIDIDPEQVISYGNQIVQHAETYSKEINKIYNIVGDLKSAWTGTAAQRFTDDIESRKVDCAKLGTVINDIGKFLVNIGEAYKSLEEDGL